VVGSLRAQRARRSAAGARNGVLERHFELDAVRCRVEPRHHAAIGSMSTARGIAPVRAAAIAAARAVILAGVGQGRSVCMAAP